MKSKVILGSGLVSLLCRKILGSNWKIIPFAPSRFYSKGVPALGDDFITYDDSVLEIVKDWGFDIAPLFFKRPYSISGSLLYNTTFSDRYLHRIGLETTILNIDRHKTDFTVFSFSCIQLWNKLLKEFIDEIKEFQKEFSDSKSVASINDHTIVLDSGRVIEYDNMISTIPYYKLCNLINSQFNGEFWDSYYYYIKDDTIDLENANQVLICDEDIPFHKCTKISKNKYLLEIVNNYYDNIQNELSKIIGSSFEILSGTVVQNGHPLPHNIDKNLLSTHDITCIGSYAQCDPLIDIGSVIKRTHNLLKKNKIEQ